MVATCRRVFVAEAVSHYAVALVRATRQHRGLKLGASPRSAIHLVAAAKAYAAIHGRGYVLPDDVQQLASAVLAHRLVPAAPARGVDAAAQSAQMVEEVLAAVPVPVPLNG
jgi:MoxR-like ATPase